MNSVLRRKPEIPKIVWKEIKPANEADSARIAIALQRAKKAYGTSRGRLLKETVKELGARASKSTRTIRFLDAGAGAGGALQDAERLSPLVESWGMAPHAHDSRAVKKYARMEDPKFGYTPPRKRWIRGYFEEITLPYSFDVIQTHFGVMHALNRAFALENLLNSLKKGGVFIMAGMEFMVASRHREASVPKEVVAKHSKAGMRAKLVLEDAYPALALKRIFGELRKQGFKTPRMGRLEDEPHKYGFPHYGPDAVKIIKLGRRKADLSRFYDHPTLNKFSLRSS